MFAALSQLVTQFCSNTMDLLCFENDFDPMAPFDTAILDDERLLRNLIQTEERYLITGSYFKCLQTDIKPSMRDVVANWMLEVLSGSLAIKRTF